MIRHSIAGTLLALSPLALMPAAEAAPKPGIRYQVDAFEDGAGVVYRIDRHRGKARYTEVGTLAEGMLPWDCTRQGNRQCGPKPWAPGVVDHKTCTTFVLADTPSRRRVHMKGDLAITYCTPGTTTWRAATDEDVEGEVI